MFKKITIVGVGLMGGSLGMAIKKHGLAKEVMGMAQKKETLDEAIKLKAIDTGETDVKKAVRNADLVILATPVNLIIKLITTINPYLRRGCIVTDMGSAKAEIVETAEKKLTNPGLFVGSHPLVGSEKKGVIYSHVDMYENAECIITPTKSSNRAAVEKVKQFWTKLGSNIKIMTPEEHDEVLAFTSHLPHILAFSMMEAIPNKYLENVSQGFKDTTRIAASSPQMWNDICMSNSKNIVHSLDELVKYLSILRKSITDRDEKSLTSHFVAAKEKRDAI